MNIPTITTKENREYSLVSNTKKAQSKKNEY